MLRKIIFLTVLILLSQFVVQAQESRITDIAWNTDGTLLAIGWDDRNAPLEIRNMVTGKSQFYDIGLLEDGYSVSMVLAWSPTIPNRIAVANHSSAVNIFTIVDDDLQLEFVFDDFLSNYQIEWNADGTRIAILGANGCCLYDYNGIQIRDAETGERLAERGALKPPLMLDVSWHPTNPHLLVYTTLVDGYGINILHWDISTFHWQDNRDTNIWETDYQRDGVRNVVWSADGTMLAGFGWTLNLTVEIHLYDIETGTVTSIFGQRDRHFAGELVWLNNNYILIDTGIFEVWDIETQSKVFQIEDAQILLAWHPISGLAYVTGENQLTILEPEDILGNV